MEKERSDLEAIETGKRQAEAIIKKREDLLYSEILKVNRALAEDLFDETIDFSSGLLTKELALQDTRLRDDKF